MLLNVTNNQTFDFVGELINHLINNRVKKATEWVAGGSYDYWLRKW